MTLDWDSSLKPVPRGISLEVLALLRSNAEGEDSITPSGKRQQRETHSHLPGASQPAMAEPPLPRAQLKHDILIQTPRPDITVGLRHSMIVEELVASGLGQVKASSFIQDLQWQQLLCSVPLQQAHSVCFRPWLLKESHTRPASLSSRHKTKLAYPEAA